jgi:hypothetical protein
VWRASTSVSTIKTSWYLGYFSWYYSFALKVSSDIVWLERCNDVDKLNLLHHC